MRLQDLAGFLRNQLQMGGYMAGNEVANIGDDWQVIRGFTRCPICRKSYFDQKPIEISDAELEALKSKLPAKTSNVEISGMLEKPDGMDEVQWSESIVVKINNSPFEFLEICRLAKAEHKCPAKN